MPLAREVVRDLAVEHGACIRPIQLRRTNLDTGAVDQVLVPCGHTLASVCPACADRAKTLRAAQCREGWHLEDEPDITPRPRHGGAEMVDHAAGRSPGSHRDQAAQAGADTTDFDELITELDAEITTAGIRGKAAPGPSPARRHRSTRRRQDAPDLPRRKISPRTVGKTYTTPDGKTFRPSLFVTLDVPVLRAGRRGRSTRRPGQSYEYDRAARDALHVRRAVRPVHPEPAPLPRLRPAVLRRHRTPAAARPARPHRHARHRSPGRDPPRPGRHLPPGLVARHQHRQIRRRPSCRSGTKSTGGYLDPATGEVLPGWDQALDELGDQPHHVARFGDQVRRPGRAGGLQGRGPVHRLPDQVPDQAGRRLPPGRHRRRPGRMPPGWPRRCGSSRARRRCANWLRYGIQPKNARPGLVPGRCKGKAHDADHLGYAGRRVLASRKWSGKTLADHRADRKEWLLSTLGVSATDPARYAWEPVAPGDPDHMDHARRLLHAVADRLRWQAALKEARRRAETAQHEGTTGRRAA